MKRMFYRSLFSVVVRLMLFGIVVLFCACIDNNNESSVSDKRAAVHSGVTKNTSVMVNAKKNIKGNFAALQPTLVTTTKTQLTTIVSPGAATPYFQDWFRYTVWLLVYLFIISISIYLRRKTGNYLAEVVNNPRNTRK